MSIFHPDLRPAVPTQVIHCCEGILKWQTPSLNDITIVCNIWVILKDIYLIFVVSEPFQSRPALHYSNSHWKMDTKTLHNSVNSFSSTLSVGVLCRGVYFVWEFLYLPQFFLKPSTIKIFFALVGRCKGWKVIRWKGWKNRGWKWWKL